MEKLYPAALIMKKTILLDNWTFLLIWMTTFTSFPKMALFQLITIIIHCEQFFLIIYEPLMETTNKSKFNKMEKYFIFLSLIIVSFKYLSKNWRKIIRKNCSKCFSNYFSFYYKRIVFLQFFFKLFIGSLITNSLK